MGKALCIGLVLAGCAALSTSTAHAQEREDFRFVPELPSFSQDGPLTLEQNGGTLRLSERWQLSAESASFRPTETVRARYEDLYFEHRLSDRTSFLVGASRFKYREHERSYRDVTYGVRWRFAF